MRHAQAYDAVGATGGADYPVTDLLQMMGRASRPDIDDAGRCARFFIALQHDRSALSFVGLVQAMPWHAGASRCTRYVLLGARIIQHWCSMLRAGSTKKKLVFVVLSVGT